MKTAGIIPVSVGVHKGKTGEIYRNYSGVSGILFPE